MPTGRRTWDLAGRLTLVGEDLDDAQDTALTAQLDPFPPSDERAAGAPDVVLRRTVEPVLRELHGPARDGRTTGVDLAGRLLSRYGDRWVEVPHPDAEQVEIGLQGGLSPDSCWADVVRPAMHQVARRRGAVVVHGAAVDGGPTGATLVCGWSESGKTEVALALLEAGAQFLTDKWTVAGEDGRLSAFPVGVGVRGWALEALPQLRAALPWRARAQLSAARTTRLVLGRGLDRAWSGRLAAAGGRAARRAVELGDRAALTPTQLRGAYGQTGDPARHVPLQTVVLLVNGPSAEVCVEDLPVPEAAARLACTAAYERRDHYGLQERGAYAGLAGRAGARDRAVAEETATLTGVLGAAQRVLRVTCPYPADPRRVVDALTASA